MKILRRDSRASPDERAKMREIIVRESDLFAGLDEEAMHDLAAKLPMSARRRGEIIVEPEEASPCFFLVKEGRVRLYRLTDDGHRLVLASLGPGEAFGQIAEAAWGSFAEAAEAAEDCTVCIVSGADLNELLQAHPVVSANLVRLLSARLRAVEEQLEAVAFHTVPARIARLLSRLAGEDGEVSGLSHQELAEMVGASRETVSRSLNEFRERGLVEVKRRSIRICDPEGLALVAEG